MNCYYKDYDNIDTKLSNLNNMLFSIVYFFYNNDDEEIVNALLTADFVEYGIGTSPLSYCFHFKGHKVTINLGSVRFSVSSFDSDLESELAFPNTLPKLEFYRKRLKLENIIADYVWEKNDTDA